MPNRLRELTEYCVDAAVRTAAGISDEAMRYAKYFELIRQVQDTNGQFKQMSNDASGPGES